RKAAKTAAMLRMPPLHRSAVRGPVVRVALGDQLVARVLDVLLDRGASGGAVAPGDEPQDLPVLAAHLDGPVDAGAAAPEAAVALAARAELVDELERRLGAGRLVEHPVEARVQLEPAHVVAD